MRTETEWGKAGTEVLLEQAKGAGYRACPQHRWKQALCLQDTKARKERFPGTFTEDSPSKGCILDCSKVVGTKPVCFSPMCNAFLLSCPALLAQAYAGTGKPWAQSRSFGGSSTLHNSYLTGSIYGEQTYGCEYLGIFGSSAPIPVLPELHVGHMPVTINCSPNKGAVAAPEASATTSPMAAPEQDQNWALTTFQPCVRATSTFLLWVCQSNPDNGF